MRAAIRRGEEETVLWWRLWHLDQAFEHLNWNSYIYFWSLTQHMVRLSFLIVTFKGRIYHLSSFQSFATCSKAPGSSDPNLNSQTGRALQISLQHSCFIAVTQTTANNYGSLCSITSKWTQCVNVRRANHWRTCSITTLHINKSNVVQGQNIWVNWIDLF